jgi:hypothetical protein
MCEKIENNKANFGLLYLLIIITVVVCLSLSSGSSSTGITDYNSTVRTIAQKNTEIERQILNSATQGFQPALEMKENVDFLLTPALLMQEAMSQGMVITYPTE